MGVRLFLGMVGFYRCFIKGFTILALPLLSLLKKNVKFYWTEEHDCESGIPCRRVCLPRNSIVKELSARSV